MAGSFYTSYMTKIKSKLTKLNFTVYIAMSFHLTTKERNYDAFFGKDLLYEVGIELY